MKSIVGAFAILGLFLFLFVTAALASIFIYFSQSDDSSLISLSQSPYILALRLDKQINSEFASQYIQKIDDAIENKKILGIVLEVDSPGGQVVPSQEIFWKVIRSKDKKPIMSYVRNSAVSGSYYSIAATSFIIANSASLIGSIGVILQTFDFSKLLEWAKVTPKTVKTGKFKDFGSSTHAWSPEEEEYIHTLIEKTRKLFVRDIQKHRDLTETTLDYLSDGRVVLGDEALNLHLVDKIGDWEDVKIYFKELLKLESLPKIRFSEDKKKSSDIIREWLGF
jgi:protease-4